MSFEKGFIIEKGNTDSLESKIYDFVNTLSEFLPVANDRNRLSYDLIKQVRHEGDDTEIVVSKNKLTINGISKEELVSKINEGLKTIS